MFTVMKILCPTDFSEGSSQAISQATDLALQFAAEVYIVNVMPIQPVLPIVPNFLVELREYRRSSAIE
jgi:nucleotide-binding universal stress UspA family protein